MADKTFDLQKFPIPTKLFIGGEWAQSHTSERLTLVSAVNDQLISEDVQCGDINDVNSAVESAAKGYAAWQALTKEQRRDALWKYAEILKRHAEELYWLEAIVTGKAKAFAAFELDAAIEALKHAAGQTISFNSETVSHGDDHLQYTTYHPYGICAAILPFNGPIVCYALKVAPALAAGNSLIVKANEHNPLSTLLAVSLAVEAGIPAGVINCVTGDGKVGHALASHMKIRKIALVGSLGVARKIQVAAAQSNLKSVTFHLGGKSPVIVFPDADLAKAGEFCCQFLMLNGQGCMLGTRVYLHESIYEPMLAGIQAGVQAYEDNLGNDPFAFTTWSSPMFHASQRERVLQFIEEGKKEATLLRGGEVVQGRGCYIRPAVFTDPLPTATILREEVFGPVVVVCKFKDDDEVIDMANDSDYGLGAYIWTNDITRALRASSRIEAGIVGVNTFPKSVDLTMQGWKQSGVGAQNGTTGLLDWQQVKSVRLEVPA